MVMGIVYSPLLLVTAYLEKKQAEQVRFNRRNHEADDDTVQEWEQIGQQAGDFESDGWAKKVESTRPNVVTDAAVLEVRELKEQIRELRELVVRMSEWGR